jgi:hypothetical protein
MADTWTTYWAFVRAGDFDGAVTEAKRVHPGAAPIELDGHPDFYVRHMVRNHIDQAKRGQLPEVRVVDA